jgi:hypothetical protein
MKIERAVGLGLSASLLVACGAAPAKPFDTMKNANVLAFRLQNFEPPPAPQAAAAPQPGMMMPGIPPEITQLAQQALPGLQALLPPGLLPPGMLQGMGQPQAAPPPPPPDAPRFPMTQPNFRILNQTQVIDPDLREELGKLLGDSDSFQSAHANCMYAEMGISFTPPEGGPPNDMLISFSCNQVQARSFAWPHANVGMTPDTVKKLDGLVQKIWPNG